MTNHTTTSDDQAAEHDQAALGGIDVAGTAYHFALSRVEMFARGAARGADPHQAEEITRAFQLGRLVGAEMPAEVGSLPTRTVTHPIARAFAWGRWAVKYEHDDGPAIVPARVMLADMAVAERSR